MDISKLKFSIEVTYDCDEGEGCYESVDNGTFDDAMKQFDIEDENGELVEIDKILDGEFEWLADTYSTSDKNEASDIPAGVIEFLEALKNGESWLRKSRIKELKKQIAKLEKKVVEAKEELEGLLNKKVKEENA